MANHWALRRHLEEWAAAEPTFQTAINCGEGQELPIDIIKLDRHNIAYRAVYPSELLGQFAGWQMGDVADLYEWAAGLQRYMTEGQEQPSLFAQDGAWESIEVKEATCPE